jgi:hypothetical protein
MDASFREVGPAINDGALLHYFMPRAFPSKANKPHTKLRNCRISGVIWSGGEGYPFCSAVQFVEQ